jgi:hypothetical protein
MLNVIVLSVVSPLIHVHNLINVATGTNEKDSEIEWKVGHSVLEKMKRKPFCDTFKRNKKKVSFISVGKMSLEIMPLIAIVTALALAPWSVQQQRN